jgi:molybdopterin/thiamine biosynthesis adenylyltransferase
MNPIIYVNKEQIHHIVLQAGASHTGVGFGMDDFSVIHAFISPPKVPPVGVPIPFQLIVLDSVESLNAADHESVNVHCETNEKTKLIAFLVIDSSENLMHRAYFVRNGNIQEVKVEFFPDKSELYSRTKGLIELDVLKEKCVCLIGQGSIGSQVTIELAKSGVPQFVFVDFDRLVSSNPFRHICGINDVGRFKIYAVRDEVLQKNPAAIIETFNENIISPTESCVQCISDSDLIICSTDNDRSRFNVNELALRLAKPAIFGRAITRAAGGDVFRMRPFDGPCYNCLFTQNIRVTASQADEELSQIRQVRSILPDYVSEEDMEAVIQVGLSSDIMPISNMMVKLALVELSHGLESGISSLEDDLVADFYIWANRRDRVYSKFEPMGFRYDRPSILRWYGARVQKDPSCPVCGQHESDLNEESIFA